MPEIHVVSGDVIEAFDQLKRAKELLETLYGMVKRASKEACEAQEHAFRVAVSTYAQFPGLTHPSLRYDHARHVLAWDDPK